jgi:hypothetical protein
VFEDKHLTDAAVAAVQKVVGHDQHDRGSLEVKDGRAVAREIA